MATIRWTPSYYGYRDFMSEFDRLGNRMSRFFEDDMHREPGRSFSSSGVFPLLNMSEDQDNYYLTAELPGVPSDSIELSVENNSMTLRGERRAGKADQSVNFHRREREAGYFRRVINLPMKIDADKVSAASDNGVLTVTLPKAAEVKPRKIAVSAN